MTAGSPGRDGDRPTSLAAAVIEEFAASGDWPVEALDDGGRLLAVEARHGAWGSALTPFDEEEVVLIESVAPLQVPAHKFQVVAELITLINDDLLLGAFALDAESGRVRVRDTVDVEALAGVGDEAVTLGVAMLASPVVTNIATMDRWLAAISIVVNGDTLPADAVAAIQARP